MAKVIEKGFMRLSYTIGKADESDFTSVELDIFVAGLVNLCEKLGIDMCGSLSPVVNEDTPEWYTPDDDDWMERMRIDTENYIAEREDE